MPASGLVGSTLFQNVDLWARASTPNVNGPPRRRVDRMSASGARASTHFPGCQALGSRTRHVSRMPTSGLVGVDTLPECRPLVARVDTECQWAAAAARSSNVSLWARVDTFPRMSGSGLAHVDTFSQCQPPGSPDRRVYRMLTLVSSLFLCRSMRPWQSVPRARSAAHGLPGSQGHGTLTSSGYGLNARLTGQHRARDTTLTRLAELQATSTSGSDRARSG